MGRLLVAVRGIRLNDAIEIDLERMFVPPSVYSRVRRTKHSLILCGFCEKCSFSVAGAEIVMRTPWGLDEWPETRYPIDHEKHRSD
jgi:hypothetical protein